MGKRVECLFLSEEDMIKAGVLNMERCVETIEETFRLVGEGDYIMGGPSGNEHGLNMFFPKEKKFPNMPVKGPERRFMAMIAYLGGRFNICGEKWYGSNVENRNLGLPRSILMVVLNHVETAEPLAIMSANILSAMRTGAAPAVGAKYLARKGAQTIGVIGAGVINRACLRGLAVVLKNVKAVKVFDVIAEQSRKYSEELGKELGLNVYPVDSAEAAVRDSDVISVAAAGAQSPSIEDEWLKDGALLAISSGVKLKEDLFVKHKVVLDEYKIHKEYHAENQKLPPGETTGIPSLPLFKLMEAGKLREEDILSLSRVVLGEKPARTDEREKIILIEFGMPVEDVAWGVEVYREALRQGIGQKLTLWNEPYWF